MMFRPTRRSLSPTVDEVIREALREDLTVEIRSPDGQPTLLIDGVELGSFDWESFSYRLNSQHYTPPESAEPLIEELLASRRRRRFARRARQLAREDHLAAEGLTLEVGASDC